MCVCVWIIVKVCVLLISWSIFVGGSVWRSQRRASSLVSSRGTWAPIKCCADCSRCTSKCSWTVIEATSEFLFCDGSSGRSRSDIVNFGGWNTNTRIVLLLHGNYSCSAVELLSEHLISINEAFEFPGQVIVLTEQNARMSLKSLFFLQLGVHVCTHVWVGYHLALDISLNDIEVLVSFFDFDVGGPNLSTQINIFRLSLFNVLSQIVTVGTDSVNILSECSSFQWLCVIEILEPSNFSLSVIQLLLSVSDFKWPGLDYLFAFSVPYYCSLEVVFKGL